MQFDLEIFSIKIPSFYPKNLTIDLPYIKKLIKSPSLHNLLVINFLYLQIS